MEVVYESFLKTCCRRGITRVRSRGHKIRKAFRHYCDVIGKNPGSMKRLCTFISKASGVIYEPTTGLYHGIFIREEWLVEPTQDKSRLRKRRMSVSEESSSTSESESSSSSNSFAESLLYIHPLLFINRYTMPAINDKITIDRDELTLYAQWNQREKTRLAGYLPRDQLNKEIQVRLLDMLEQEKQLVDDMYARPRTTAISIGQTSFVPSALVQPEEIAEQDPLDMV
jgi:hypothetical protein